MSLYSITFCLFGLMWFTAIPQAHAVDTPTPKITANGSQNPITVQTITPININVSLDSSNAAGQNADWWVVAYGSSLGWYSYVYPSGWVQGIANAAQSPLFNLSQFNVFSGYLPPDQYRIYFGVDKTPDKIINEPLFYNSVQLTIKPAIPSFYDLDVGCPIYFTLVNSPSWFWSYNGQAKSLDVSITERDGSLIKKLSSGNGFSFYSGSNYYPRDIEEDIKKNKDKYLTFTCTYKNIGEKIQVFQYRHPIADNEIWEQYKDTGIPRTTTSFEISMLSDIQMRLWMALMKRGYSESDAWLKSHTIVADAFPDVKYGDLRDESLITSLSARQDMSHENTPNGRAFRKLKLIAEAFTSEPTGDVQTVIDVATKDYIRGKVESLNFLYPALTGAVFTQLTSTISKDSENFVAASWLSYQSDDKAFTSTSRVNLDGSWEASLEWQSGTANAEYSVQKYQAINLPTINYDKYFLDFSLIRAVGGCTQSIFGCIISSGVAGIFACFENNAGIPFGCTLWSALSDLITIPNHLGEVFKADAPFGLSAIEIVSIASSSPNSDAFGLDRTIALSKLFEVSSNSTLRSAAARGEVTRIEFGAVILASSVSCYKCKAEISARRLGIKSLQ